MCIILDTNFIGEYLRPTEDMLPLMKWVEEGGKIAYSPTPELKEEFERLFREYGRSERLKFIDKEDVEREEERIKNDGQLRSNDSHIIALAIVGNIKLLVSRDRKLGEDFKKMIHKGKIYKEKEHSHLLENVDCP